MKAFKTNWYTYFAANKKGEGFINPVFLKFCTFKSKKNYVLFTENIKKLHLVTICPSIRRRDPKIVIRLVRNNRPPLHVTRVQRNNCPVFKCIIIISNTRMV